MKIKDIEINKKKVVLIGKNGSGKSMTLVELYNQYLDKSTFIPSARSVYEFSANLQNITDLENNNKAYVRGRKFVSNTDVLFISKLFSKDYQELNEKRKAGKIADKDYIQEVNNILKEVSPEFQGIKAENFRLTNIANYDLSNSSDGEKHTIVLICAVLSALAGSIILIDEPEIGIHNAALKSLFDNLERHRKDCTFIYATHNLDFAKTREDAHIIYVCNKSLKEVKDDDLEKDLLIEINGVAKPIILVEGNETDRKLYSKIFKNFEVKNGDGCGQIKNRVNAVRRFFNRRDVFGLLDGDGKTDEKNEELKSLGCFSIPVAQHEHLYILPDVLQSYLNDCGKTEKAIDIVIMAIQKAKDYGRHDTQEKESIQRLSKEINENTVIDFLKVYRGKDLIGYIESKIEMRNIKQNMLNRPDAIHLIGHYLKIIKDEISETALEK